MAGQAGFINTSIIRCISVSCPAGTYRNSDVSSCSECEINSISTEGASSCAACAAGTVADKERTKCGEYPK